MNTRQVGLQALLLAATVVVSVAADRLLPVGAFQAGDVTARAFQVLGREGHIQAELRTMPDGNPGLVMRDRGGRERVRLRLTNTDWLRLSLSDASSNVRSELYLQADGNPGLNLKDRQGRDRASLDLVGDGVPCLYLYDRSGKIRIGLGLADDGAPHVNLFGKGSRPRVLRPD